MGLQRARHDLVTEQQQQSTSGAKLMEDSSSVSSVQSLNCVWLCDLMNRSTPGLPVHHQLLEFTQTHVRRVSDAIQPSHPLSSPSPPAPNPSQELSNNTVSKAIVKIVYSTNNFEITQFSFMEIKEHKTREWCKWEIIYLKEKITRKDKISKHE